MTEKKNPHVSEETFDDFLKEQGLLAEAEKAALAEIEARRLAKGKLGLKRSPS